jgi:hypothetical protein
MWFHPQHLTHGNITPYELVHRVKPDISHFRVFGCTAYVHVQKDQRDGAFGHHMQKCVFLGYPEGYKGWRFYNPTTKKVIITERADFDERYMPLKPYTLVWRVCTYLLWLKL